MKLLSAKYRAQFIGARAYRLRRFFIKAGFGTAIHPLLNQAYRRTHRKTKQAMASAIELSGFREHAKNCEFSHGWSQDITACAHLAAHEYRQGVGRILEIGSYEGRSAVFLAGYFPNAVIDCCDTFAGGSDLSAAHDFTQIERRFDKNVAQFGERIRKHKGLSRHTIPKLEQAGNSYDLVYVDGNHFHDDVLIDTLLSWPMLSAGGVMIWDDYSWYGYRRKLSNTRAAVDRFLDVHKGEYEPLVAGRMVVVRKKDGLPSQAYL